ncbi:DUF1800 domain-containing protein [Photobacterium lutimaris]|uniref:DUF1800 domain-containing protein n=1 Tax=Photobacterium lutimaris TaxID=388278 RepID=A0A2T3J5G2_9GAMM|nr:DUF1800 domain-containing protein [Photobacterium lutimaris]PSU36522.1 DUF1800 domain-containing protein [Photobacterium lutimaris]TDR69943.1 uncharacterized protein DUF1800 [Photobacterium lutimaris]
MLKRCGFKSCICFLGLSLLSACGGGGESGSGNGGVQPPIPPEPIPLTQDQRYDLLYRSTFGPQPDSYQELTNLGYVAWLDKQFSMAPSLHSTRLKEYPLEGDTDSYNQADRAAVWWDLSLNAPDQLRQRVAFALSEIFVISRYGASLGGRALEMTDYYDMLITHAFGNYRDLIESVTLHAAMGDYLSMMANQKADPERNRYPDENYAREVMQLFSIGLYELNPDGTEQLDSQGQLIPTYSQDDIENLARVFTGWHIAEKNQPWWGSKDGNWFLPMVAYPEHHDDEEKVVMGEVFAQGQTAEQDMAQAMDMLLNHSNTAPLISKHLIQRLVTSNPSPAYVARVSALFADNGEGVRGDLEAVIRGVLTDSEALSGDERSPVKMKEPLIAMTNFFRALEAKSADPSGRFHNSIGTFGSYGQSPLGSPSVFNFFSPDYAPNGEIAAANDVAPEFEILSWNNFILTNNQLWAATGRTDYEGEDNPNRIVINTAPLEAIANDHSALVDEIERRLLSQRMSEPLRGIVLEGLEDLRDTQQSLKVRNALYIVVTSQEFHIEELAQ